MKRESGYYWVLFKNLRGWEVVRWNEYYWEHDSRVRHDKDFKKIDERKIERLP